ncbi:putative anthranilate synthase component I [Trichinella spiralis]|uniref:putative anthranilate synthase component I n=1 Tax=Trichinella spiralis TaxID=6334 RepID=UPI0001EFB783|nr:putative anthranilate synthase component I [Trichinella spiralis]
MHHLQHYGQIATRHIIKSTLLSFGITKSSDFEAICNSYEVHSEVRPTALKALEKLIAECRLKNQKYGYLDMLCGTRWSGNTTALPLMQSSYELQHVEAVLLFR